MLSFISSGTVVRSASSYWIFLALSVAFNAGGTLLLKKSRVDPFVMHVGTLHFSPWVPLALVSYGLNFIVFTAALSKIPLYTAYPVQIGMTFAIITTLSPMLFGERFGAVQIFGIAAILVGVCVLARS